MGLLVGSLKWQKMMDINQIIEISDSPPKPIEYDMEEVKRLVKDVVDKGIQNDVIILVGTKGTVKVIDKDDPILNEVLIVDDHIPTIPGFHKANEEAMQKTILDTLCNFPKKQRKSKGDRIRDRKAWRAQWRK